MIPLEVPERIFGLFPSSFISTDGAEATVEPILLVDAEEDSVYLTRGAVVVLAGLVPSHASGQGLGRYFVCEDGSQEVDCHWVASVGDATGLDEDHIWRIFGRRMRLLTETYPSVRVCGHSTTSCWAIHWSGIGVVGEDRRARPKVSL